MRTRRRHGFHVVSIVAAVATLLAACSDSSANDAGPDRQEALDQAVKELVAMPGGPPGAIVVVQRGAARSVHAAGVAAVGSDAAPSVDDHMRVASVAKAFQGAAVLALVDDGVLALDDTIGERLPDLPQAWHDVTVRQMLDHTSGLPDYTKTDAFVEALTNSPGVAPPPTELLAWVEDKPLVFPRGSQYEYSNSDNIVVGLMLEAVTGKSYADVLAEQVFGPLELEQTSLPAETEMPDPLFHGYALDPDGKLEDLSTVFSAGYAWASGGIVSTPGDLNDFIRGYVGGTLYGDARAPPSKTSSSPAVAPNPADRATTRPAWPCSGTTPRAAPCTATPGTSSATRSSPPPRPMVDDRQPRRSHCSAHRGTRVRTQVSSPRCSASRRQRSATPSNESARPQRFGRALASIRRSDRDQAKRAATRSCRTDPTMVRRSGPIWVGSVTTVVTEPARMPEWHAARPDRSVGPPTGGRSDRI